MKLVWFRNDLRVADNPALYYACQSAGPAGVVAVAAITPGQWLQQDESRSRVAFWLANLRRLAQELAALNIPLKLIHATDNNELPSRITALAGNLGADAIYFNREYPLYEQRRDHDVTQQMKRFGIAVHVFDADLVMPPGSVRNKQGGPFRVFTPFSRAWRQRYVETLPEPLPVPGSVVRSSILSDEFPCAIDYPSPVEGAVWRDDLWPAGAAEAHGRLTCFVEDAAADYGVRRDFPARDATSSLSPYLSIGVLSVRQCLAALRVGQGEGAWLESQWVTELIWREFYRHLLIDFPAMNAWQPFRPEVEGRITWMHDSARFEAWCRGETGYPLVDAGMKQLLETGWMHNRLRMVTASFLTKLMREDWRRGARFFMQHLIDGDFASNLGGWQWSASVGADAAPYFRIFNPQLQAERFDQEGAYIARWLPELASLPPAQRRDPRFAQQRGRPPAVIDYAMERKRSIALYNGESTQVALL